MGLQQGMDAPTRGKGVPGLMKHPGGPAPQKMVKPTGQWLGKMKVTLSNLSIPIMKQFDNTDFWPCPVPIKKTLPRPSLLELC